MKHNDLYYMKKALKEAELAYKEEEVPIGCVIVDENGTIIAKAHNQKEKKEDVTAHAEILAIKKASKKRKNWRLNGCSIYITLEPCLMCASVIAQSRFDKIVIALKEENTGAFGSHSNINDIEGLNLNYFFGPLENESRALLVGFFKKRRQKTK